MKSMASMFRRSGGESPGEPPTLASGAPLESSFTAVLDPMLEGFQNQLQNLFLTGSGPEGFSQNEHLMANLRALPDVLRLIDEKGVGLSAASRGSLEAIRRYANGLREAGSDDARVSLDENLKHLDALLGPIADDVDDMDMDGRLDRFAGYDEEEPLPANVEGRPASSVFEEFLQPHVSELVGQLRNISLEVAAADVDSIAQNEAFMDKLGALPGLLHLLSQAKGKISSEHRQQLEHVRGLINSLNERIGESPSRALEPVRDMADAALRELDSALREVGAPVRGSQDPFGDEMDKELEEFSRETK